jgi:hypothetical protein
MTDNDCKKSKGLPCGESPSVCELTKTGECCWHTDTRSYKEKSTIYLDRFGFVILSDYKIDAPIDIHYCPSCKKSKINRDDLVAILIEKVNHQELARLEKSEKARNIREQQMLDKLEKARIKSKIEREEHEKYKELERKRYELKPIIIKLGEKIRATERGARRNALIMEYDDLNRQSGYKYWGGYY